MPKETECLLNDDEDASEYYYMNPPELPCEECEGSGLVWCELTDSMIPCFNCSGVGAR